MIVRAALCALSLLLAPSSGGAPALPAGPGLAARYPGDHGLARDARVVWFEDFETGDLPAIGRRWGEASNAGQKALALVPDSPAASRGKQALRITSTLGENTGGHLYTRFPKGYDRLFVRFYVKFASDAAYVHHFVHVGGYNPPTRYPQGGAGERPRGDDRMTVGIEPTGDYGRFAPPGVWNLYAYWPEMKRSADGKYWGASLRPAADQVVPKERWQCVELMMKCNSLPEKSDGELALWLDGKLVMHIGPGTPRGPWDGMGFHVLPSGGEPFSGFRWRTDDRLKINFLWLMLYVTEQPSRQAGLPKAPVVNRVWFDNVVAATDYIGPLAARR